MLAEDYPERNWPAPPEDEAEGDENEEVTILSVGDSQFVRVTNVAIDDFQWGARAAEIISQSARIPKVVLLSGYFEKYTEPSEVHEGRMGEIEKDTP